VFCGLNVEVLIGDRDSKRMKIFSPHEICQFRTSSLGLYKTQQSITFRCVLKLRCSGFHIFPFSRIIKRINQKTCYYLRVGFRTLLFAR
jgi:hypothetical protein